ncbi:unnamed protein product [Macrosiphum euphorbiae]|uniref:Uncharacterized protein n=1 Tax=Macrosiphum euphorbiae TaxID=13131 RepID=A0AAV0XCC3_9HEMI|nr:unnamed protein product [Macrosiphum euphorbiae]
MKQTYNECLGSWRTVPWVEGELATTFGSGLAVGACVSQQPPSVSENGTASRTHPNIELNEVAKIRRS